MSKHLIPALLVLLFMYTGCSKLFSLSTFTDNMSNQPIPHWLSRPMTVVLPCAEILTAVSLLLEKSHRAGLYSAASLLTIFTVYVAAILLHFFRYVPCSCGGIFKGLSWPVHLCLNLLLLTLTLLQITTFSKRTFSITIKHSL